MKTVVNLKKPFGTVKMVEVAHGRYLPWEDAFDVEFEDGISFLEPHKTVRRANKIDSKATPVRVELDEECRLGFESELRVIDQCNDLVEVGQQQALCLRRASSSRHGRM